MEPDYLYRATVTRVVDGDTVDADVDLGFHTHVRLRFRLLGIDAPETYGVRKTSNEYAAGMIAKTWLVDRVEKLEIMIESVKTGKFGRWLGVLWVDGVSVNQEMIELGLAGVYE